jgi:hypothetical protein
MSAKSPFIESRIASISCCFCDDGRIWRLHGQDISQAHYFMACLSKRSNDRVGDAVVGQKPQGHQMTASNSASSRA